MEQEVHLEIEVLVCEKTPFYQDSDIGKWCWAMSYSPTKEESIGFNALLTEGLRTFPKTLSKEVGWKMATWKHQEIATWFYVSEVLEFLDDTHIPFSVRKWFLSWGSEHLALLGDPSQLRLIIWVTEGMYD